MKDFIDEHFAVLAVLAVFILLFSAYLFELRHGSTIANTLDWLEGEMKEVIGAILMGLTGGRIARAVNGGTNGTQPNTTTPTVSVSNSNASTTS